LGSVSFPESWLSLGGLPDNYTQPVNASWFSHRIAGSFHWQLKLNSIKVGGQSFLPQSSVMLTDTGTTISYLLP